MVLSHRKVKYEDNDFWGWSGQERLDIARKKLSDEEAKLAKEKDPEKQEKKKKEVDKQRAEVTELSDKFEKYAAKKYLDDDVLGFMHARQDTVSRRGNLEVTRGISTTPWAGEVMQNFASPGSNPISNEYPIPYAVEVHHTRYQFGFALTPDALGRERNYDDQGEPMDSVHDAEERVRRVQATLDGLCNPPPGWWCARPAISQIIHRKQSSCE